MNRALDAFASPPVAAASQAASLQPVARLRPYPYPYRAMLAIASDLDETPDAASYFEVMRYLNGTAPTAFGPGLGLEVGNSIYFDMPAGQFSYWNAHEAERERLRVLIRSGHIDCLHSFGDLATTRAHAARALEELDRHGCRLEVWVDHGTARTNFGADIMQGEGDVPGAPAYHADLTSSFGIRYVWRGRVTSVIGQDIPRRLAGLWRFDHPFASTRTVAKEFAKGWLGRHGSPKYAMHASNRLLREVRLRDGRPMREFLRANPSWGGVSCHETAAGIAEVLTDRLLDTLIARGGVCVLYTHLGKPPGAPALAFGARTRQAFERLAERYRSGALLVATTQRVLRYHEMRAQVRVRLSPSGVGSHGESWRLDLESPLPPAAHAGLTVYVPEPARTRVFLNGQPLAGLECYPADDTGWPSLGLPWRRLAFPLP
jgi:hypothetical protein